MATTNFQIFDESMTDIDTDIEYLAESQRLNGVTPGLAAPKMHNKLYRQCSVMAYAIANVIAARGYNANDSDPGALINAIQRAFAFSVNGNIPGDGGAVTMSTPLDAWPVGSIFITTSSANPSALLGGGTWTKIQGQYLLASSNSYTAGNTYGDMTKTLTVDNLPGHTHGFTTASSGAHTHTVSGTGASAGSHSHTLTVASNGAHTHTVSGTAASAGAHTHTISTDSKGAHTHTTSGSAASNGAHTHTVSTVSAGAHTHSVSGTSGGAGTHSHTRGTMNITASGFMGEAAGKPESDYYTKFKNQATGALYYDGTSKYGSNGGIDTDDYTGYFDASRSWTGSTSTVANHTHSFSATSTEKGAHTHSGTAASNGAHTHTTSGTAASNGNHTHGGSAASAGAHTHSVSGTAASNGAHAHTATAASDGAHTHSVSGTAASNGGHTHTGTTNSTGSGTAVNVMPLSLAVNVWRRTA